MDALLLLFFGVLCVDSLLANGSTVLQSMETKTREPGDSQQEPNDKRTLQERSIVVGAMASSSSSAAPNQTTRRQRDDDDDDDNAGDDDDYDGYLFVVVGKTEGVKGGGEYGRGGKGGTRALEGKGEVGGGKGKGRGRKSRAREGKEMEIKGENRRIGEEGEGKRREGGGIGGGELRGRETEEGGIKRGGMRRGVGSVGEIERGGIEERGGGGGKGVERREGGGSRLSGGAGGRKSGGAAELGGGTSGENRAAKDGVSAMPSKQDRLRRQDNGKASLTPPSAPTSTTAFPSSSATPDNQSLSLSPLDFVDILQNYPTIPNCASSSTKNLPLDYPLPQSLYPMFAEQSSNLVQIANVLNNLFAHPGGPETGQSFHYTDAFYYSLVRAVVESHDVVSTAAIVFEKTQYETKDHPFGPFAYRNRTNGRIFIRHLTNNSQGIFARDGITDIDRRSWLERPSQPSVPPSIHSQPPSAHSSKAFPDPGRNVCDPPSAPLTTDSTDRLINVSPVVTIATDGRWSRPHFDCASRTWLITFSVPFFSCANTALNLKGVVKVDVDLSKVDINQCPNAGGIFQNTHKCLPTTQCVPVVKHGFRRGGYRCQCLSGYYFPVTAIPQGSSPSTPKVSYFNGTDIERHYPANMTHDSSGAEVSEFDCLPCAEGCPTCDSGSTCLGSDDFIVSMIALALQSFAMTSTLLAGVVIIRLRHTKVMKASFWLLLEIIILGALMMYATVVIQYVSPSDVTCILVPWFREVGFVIVYGSLLLKVYRVLAEFQSRKAQRILLRDKDLLKYLAAMVTIVVGYMVTWTVINVDHIWKGATMVQTIDGEHRTKYSYCSSTWWDSVIEIEEFLFLLSAIYICYCIRSAPSFYLESKFISWAIYNETALSAIFNIVRHSLWITVHPNYLYWMFFIRCQLTVTVTLLLVIGTKVWYTHRPPDDAICRRRTYSTTDAHEANAPEATKLTPSVGYGGGGGAGGGGGGGGVAEGEVADINLSEMNPDDIRAELKRLYTQLQIYKTKSMRKDNPHISKRRGGRKPTHRRFSLQAFHYNKHKLHQGSEVTSAEHENEASRSPEESTNSVDVVPGGAGAGEGEGGLSGGGVEGARARSTSLSSRAASVGHR